MIYSCQSSTVKASMNLDSITFSTGEATSCDNAALNTSFDTSLNSSIHASLPLKDVRVLVVDDNADIRELFSLALQWEGADVITAASASEALRLLTSLQPDVLVSDIKLPIEDGYTLLQKLRRVEAMTGKITPAIAVTAYVIEIDCLQALSAGFQTYLPKPIDLDELVAAISALVR
jgi:two-component system, OmpR family, response regulator